VLGLVPRGGNYESVRAHIERLGLIQPGRRHRRRRRGLGSVTAEELAEAVRTARSVAEVARSLEILVDGGGAGRLAIRIKELGLDMTHFRGRGWRRGATTPVFPATPLAEVLAAARPVPTNYLKKRLIAAGLKERVCEGCQHDAWCGEPIPLELDHVNGDRRDNRLENLRLLCPNCHAMTATYRGRNIGRAVA
jgi:HNH endonuclease